MINTFSCIPFDLPLIFQSRAFYTVKFFSFKDFLLKFEEADATSEAALFFNLLSLSGMQK